MFAAVVGYSWLGRLFCSVVVRAVAVMGVIFIVGSQEGGLRDQILLARRLSEHEGFLSEL